jgi:hypothetical protein
MVDKEGREPVPIVSRIKSSFLKVLTGSRYLALWVSFVLLMVLTPFTAGPIGSVVLSIIFSFVLISGILTVSRDRRLLIVGLIPLVIALTSRWISYFTDSQALQSVAFLFGTITLAYVAFLLFSSLFKAREITSTIIWQAISVYLLIGLAWAALFMVVEGLSPGSFQDNTGGALNYPAIVYYSFVTLATLGYGDILPMTSTARGLAVLEVLTGVLFMAILISRLVGAWKPVTKE